MQNGGANVLPFGNEVLTQMVASFDDEPRHVRAPGAALFRWTVNKLAATFGTADWTYTGTSKAAGLTNQAHPSKPSATTRLSGTDDHCPATADVRATAGKHAFTPSPRDA